MSNQLQRYVTNGSNWLDEIMPDWYKKIDKTTLHMRSLSDCIMGQLDLWKRLDDEDKDSSRLGFDSNMDDWSKNMIELQGLWLEEINRKLELDRELDATLEN